MINNKDIRKTPKVCVEWEDSFTSSRWITPDSISDICRCCSAGYIIRETKKTISIASSISSTGEASGVITIPISAIQRKVGIK